MFGNFPNPAATVRRRSIAVRHVERGRKSFSPVFLVENSAQWATVAAHLPPPVLNLLFYFLEKFTKFLDLFVNFLATTSCSTF